MRFGGDGTIAGGHRRRWLGCRWQGGGTGGQACGRGRSQKGASGQHGVSFGWLNTGARDHARERRSGRPWRFQQQRRLMTKRGGPEGGIGEGRRCRKIQRDECSQNRLHRATGRSRQDRAFAQLMRGHHLCRAVALGVLEACARPGRVKSGHKTAPRQQGHHQRHSHQKVEYPHARRVACRAAVVHPAKGAVAALRDQMFSPKRDAA